MPSNQILVIEDHPLFATGIKDLVEFVATNAKTLLCAANIAHAIELLNKTHPALKSLPTYVCQTAKADVIDTFTTVSANLPTLIMSGDDTLLHSVVPNQHAPSWTLSNRGFEQTFLRYCWRHYPCRTVFRFSGAPTHCRTAKPTRAHHWATGQNNGIQLTHKQQQCMHFLASGAPTRVRKSNLSAKP